LAPSVEVAVALGLLVATVGTLTSRVDLVLLAVPLLLTAALGLDRQPVDGASSTLNVYVARRADAEGAGEFEYRVELQAPLGTEFVHLRVSPAGLPPYHVVLAPRNAATVTGNCAVGHSGRLRIVEVSYRLIGVDGEWLTLATPAAAAERVIDPRIVPLRGIPIPHRLTGLTGAHASARPGDGGEFRDLHPYAAGDRLRRIDWKATARRSQGRGDLYVRRTDATSDATVVLVIDSRDDIGEFVAAWSGRTSSDAGRNAMDVSREAAASLAVAAVDAGDRVGLIDLAVHNGLVSPGSGKRHLDRLLRRISASEPSGARFSRHRAPIVPAGAIIYCLSTFLDDDAADLALLWRASGHRVIAVDVLPFPTLDDSPPRVRSAHRLLMAERRRRIATLRRTGGELFRWLEDDGSPSRAIAMHALSRAGRRR
jgi:uncharacterized protein (DUF58 family)